MLSFLEITDGFIKLSKQPHKEAFEQWVELPNHVKLRQLDCGVLQVLPAQPTNEALVISCGIHGNETAPIEIVSHQISQIVLGSIIPKVNVLYILGNPESMNISQRFVELNMNRLFAGAYKNYDLSEATAYEIKRAERLESLVSDFYLSFNDEQRIHLDLHTAIKPSYHKTFAIRPYDGKRITKSSKKLLLAAGIEAVLQHNKPSTTFSYYTNHVFNAESYTLELGKVKPFGENNAADFALAVQCLDALVQAKDLAQFDVSNLVEYKVVAEIIRNTDDFKFYVSENVENFTAFPQGSLIAEDIDYNYRVAFAEEAVVFPNINVPNGQRVAVMVTKVNRD